MIIIRLYILQSHQLEKNSLFSVAAQETQINEEDKEFWESLIQLSEVKGAISRLKFNKSPGTDGFTADFYKKM